MSRWESQHDNECAVRDHADAFLTSHIAAEHFSEEILPPSVALKELLDSGDRRSIFLSLEVEGHHKHLGGHAPPMVPLRKLASKAPLSAQYVWELHGRLLNYRTILPILNHGHPDPIAWGVFPAISRLIDHSCIPSAFVTFQYRNRDLRKVTAQVRTLWELREGDEVRTAPIRVVTALLTVFLGHY